jgi:hypothetical protein
MHRPLTGTWRPRSWVVGACLAAAGPACGPRAGDPGKDPGMTEASTTDDDPTGDSHTGATIPPPDCEAPEVACGTECVDLQSNGLHCGRCDHRCDPYGPGVGTGRCHEGRCTSGFSECIVPEDGLRTCREGCAHFGRECEDREEPVPYSGAGGCRPGYGYFLDGFSDFPCDSGAGGSKQGAACEEEISWDHTDLLGSEQVAVRCCFKQDW